MNIKTASNTPALVRKIIGSNTFSLYEDGMINKQIFTINSPTTSYKDNSSIIITNIETYYSDIGLLNIPTDIESNDNLNAIELSNDISEDPVSSIIYNIEEVEKFYNNILELIKNSSNALDYISKETYILLGIQNLINIDYIISKYISSNDNIKYCNCDNNFKNFINNTWNMMLSISKGIKYLYLFIGQSSISYNYSLKISTKLTTTLNILDITLNNLITDMTFNTDDKQSFDSIKISLKDYLENIQVFEDKIPTFSDFIMVALKIINHIELILKIISSSTSYKPNSTSNSIDSIYSIINTVNLIDCTISAIDYSYSNIVDNYSLIVNKIKDSLLALESITIINNDVNLINKLNKSVIIKKSSTKLFNNTTENVKKDMKENLEETNITKSINLNLSFYVCNLNIKVSGTIGDDNFTGDIFYSNLYNLSYFAINDKNIIIDIDVPQNINSFDVSQSLNPTIKASSVIASSNYTSSNLDNFNADIILTFELNGEVLITALAPIVFAK